MQHFDELENFIDSFIDMGIPGTDCIVYHKGECVYRHMNGFSDYEKRIPVNGKEKYNIYSASKPITCAAALQLYEKGLFKLDDPLYMYMPEFENMTVIEDGKITKAKNVITIRNLFTMTAGFTYDCQSESLKLAVKETNGKCPTRETMKYLAKEPLVFEPGTMWNYSLCHDVLAALVEVISGKKFGEYAKENIFTPLGMNNTSFSESDDTADEKAAQYAYNGESKQFENCGKDIQGFKIGSEYESGGAGCISTVEDYIKFTEAMRIGDIILKTETIDKMATNQLNKQSIKGYSWENLIGKGYGLGVRCSLDDCKSDFGWGGAAGAYLSIDRKNEMSLFYAQHVLSSPNQDIRNKIRAYVLDSLI